MGYALQHPEEAQKVDLEHLEHLPIPALVQLLRRLRGLGIALAQIQPDIETGRVTATQAEWLPHLSTEVARQLEADLVNLPAAVFLEGAA